MLTKDPPLMLTPRGTVSRAEKLRAELRIIK
jgi:hypothetical protein